MFCFGNKLQLNPVYMRPGRSQTIILVRLLFILDVTITRKVLPHPQGTDDRLYQMSHSAKIVSTIFYEHTLAAILAVSVIHAMKREQSRILAVSTILEVSVARGSKCRENRGHENHRDRYTVRHLVQSIICAQGIKGNMHNLLNKALFI